MESLKKIDMTADMDQIWGLYRKKLPRYIVLKPQEFK